MSVLKIATGKDDKVIKAKESKPFRIYKKNFPAGPIKIPITYAPM